MKFCGGYVSIRYTRVLLMVKYIILDLEKVSKQAKFYIA